jgi:hypothetical protein
MEYLTYYPLVPSRLEPTGNLNEPVLQYVCTSMVNHLQPFQANSVLVESQ